eukprot:gene13145-17613_t
MSDSADTAIETDVLPIVIEDINSKRKRDDDDPNENNETSTEANSEEIEVKKQKQDDYVPISNPVEVPATDHVADVVHVVPASTTQPTSATISTVITTTANANGETTIMMEISPDKVGQVIGSKGAIIQEIQTRTGAKAFVNQDFPAGVNRQVSITGQLHQARAAADLIKLIIDQGPTAIHLNMLAGGPTITSVIECSQNVVGRVIGTSGATIKEVQSKSGAKIQIDQDFPPEVPRKINITGTGAAVSLAIQLINKVIEGGSITTPAPAPTFPSNPYGSVGMYGQPNAMINPYGVPSAVPSQGQSTQTLEIPKLYVGKIIGKGGETISMIQTKSNCRVNIDQNVGDGKPCKVVITGPPHGLGIATQLISEVMMNTPQGGAGRGAGAAPISMPQMNGVMPYGMPPMQQPYGMTAYPGLTQPMPQMQPQMPQQQQQYVGYGGYQQPMQQLPSPYGMPGQVTGYPNPYATAAPVVQQQYSQPAATYAPVAAPVAATPVKAPPASVWTEHKTDDGVPYWYNSSTGVSQWERPTA